MKVLVTGVKGQLGYDICKCLDSINIENKGIDRDEADLTNEFQIKNVINAYKPSLVIHCAAYTAVDKAEDERDICYSINVLGTRYIAEACNDIGAKLMYFSTDYVFEGLGDHFYTEQDNINPQSFYGLTKYQGEEEVRKVKNHYILRISWVYGINGNNFVKTMLKLAETRDEISVVSDQIGSPTYTEDVANLVCNMIQTEKYGTYHVTNSDICSWYEFACEIFRLKGINVKVNPIKTSEYPTKAVRPINSRLSKDKLLQEGFEQLPSWKDALERYINLI